MKFKLDWPLITAAVRTAGALMVGNVFVSSILLGNRNWLGLGALLLFGILAIIVTSMTRKD